MNETYKVIESLCESKGITVNKMCREIKVSNSLLSDFKSGRTKKLSTATLEKISVFFRVPIDYLLNTGEPDPRDIPPEPPITDDQLLFALYGEVPEEITEEDMKDIRNFAAWKLQTKRTEKNKEG